MRYPAHLADKIRDAVNAHQAGQTLDEIAKKLQVTRERVRQYLAHSEQEIKSRIIQEIKSRIMAIADDMGVPKNWVLTCAMDIDEFTPPTPIELTWIELPIRARKAAQKLGVSDLPGFARVSENELLSIPNIGITTVNIIKRALLQHNLHLRQGDGNE